MKLHRINVRSYQDYPDESTRNATVIDLQAEPLVARPGERINHDGFGGFAGFRVLLAGEADGLPLGVVVGTVAVVEFFVFF